MGRPYAEAQALPIVLSGRYAFTSSPRPCAGVCAATNRRQPRLKLADAGTSPAWLMMEC